MRKRPIDVSKAEKFINDSSAEQTKEGLDELYKCVKGNVWPLQDTTDICTLAEGSNLKKPILINTNEKEWLTIERHLKDLNVSVKTEWYKNAIFKTIKEEQIMCLKKTKNKM
ncbi:hypothetical protein NOVO_09100 (plasmid) [Rickettsiales bacterium Ac37b]|nr:hypothetical protein NOVO_09100 [Rickettsiales bacterium Ac37b]